MNKFYFSILFILLVGSSFSQVLMVDCSGSAACSGQSNGSAVAMPSGGTMPITFLWSNGVTTQTTSGITNGTYCNTVTDAVGATSTCCVELTALSTTSLKTDESCGNDGTGTAFPMDGTVPYSYLWDNGVTTATAPYLSSGPYVYTVTDNIGCTATDEVQIAPAPLFTASIQVDQEITCTKNGELTALPEGGEMPYNFLWSNAGITTSILGLGVGLYTVTVTDFNGCTAIAPTAEIMDNRTFSTFSLGDDIISCAGDGEILIGVPNAINASYFWSGGSDATTSMISIPDEVLVPTNFTLLIEDGDNCSTGSILVSIEEGCQEIPTLGQWGLMVLAMSLLIFSVVTLKVWNKGMLEP